MSDFDISFIVPVYNAEVYLERCVRSILNQKIGNFEIILINDGSEDKSLDICQNFQKEYSNIVLIDQKNKGQGAARNVGIKAASGTWLCFVDNDDWLEPTFCEECFKYMQKDIDIIFVAKRDVYAHSKKNYLLNIDQPVYLIDSVEEKEVLQLFTLNFFIKFPINFGKLPIGVPWGKLVRTEILKKNNCYFVDGYGEDRPCMIKVYDYAGKILIINKVLYNYYIHESTMRKYLPSAADKYKKSLYEMNQYVNTRFNQRKEFREQLNHFNIAWFSYCIVQDFCNSKNPKSYKQRKNDFICAFEDEYYRDAFHESDLRCLPFRRRMLAFLVKNKLFRAIDIMNKLNYCYENIANRPRKE